MGMITKLQAVNNMLLAAGESLVADLDNESGIDTEIALTILENTSLDYQLRGLVNNKYVRKINPNAASKIVLPMPDADEEGIISIELVSTHFNKDGILIQTRLLNSSPPRMWNVTDDTDIFAKDIDYYWEIIQKIKWENLDTPAQRAIMTTAMRHYQIVTQGDQATDNFLAYQEQIFSAKQRAADINDKKRNIFRSGDISVRSAVNRVPFSSDPSRFRYWRTV